MAGKWLGNCEIAPMWLGRCANVDVDVVLVKAVKENAFSGLAPWSWGIVSTCNRRDGNFRERILHVRSFA